MPRQTQGQSFMCMRCERRIEDDACPIIITTVVGSAPLHPMTGEGTADVTDFPIPAYIRELIDRAVSRDDLCVECYAEKLGVDLLDAEGNPARGLPSTLRATPVPELAREGKVTARKAVVFEAKERREAAEREAAAKLARENEAAQREASGPRSVDRRASRAPHFVQEFDEMPPLRIPDENGVRVPPIEEESPQPTPPVRRPRGGA